MVSLTADQLALRVCKRVSADFVLDVACSASPGITILFGASGAGKTTLLRCIAGLVKPDDGRIAVGDRTLFDSVDGVDLPAHRRQIGYLFQDLALFPHLTVAANVDYGIARLDRRARRERTLEITERFGIAHLLARRPREISGGERQRVALARALVTSPCALLLDEPLSALDYPTQLRLMEDLRAWNAARRIPVVYVTHAHRELYALGERIVVLHQGRITAEGPPSDVLDAPAHEPLAQLAGFENLIDATVVQRRAEAGVMRCRIGASHADGSGARFHAEMAGVRSRTEGLDRDLEVPLSPADAGAAVRIAVRAGDILLATEQPHGLSARNVLPGVIRRLSREGPLVIADVEAGHRFVVHLTPGASEALHLAAGQHVWLVIKTHSLKLVAS